jgi:hypothetical protein
MIAWQHPKFQWEDKNSSTLPCAKKHTTKYGFAFGQKHTQPNVILSSTKKIHGNIGHCCVPET